MNMCPSEGCSTAPWWTLTLIPLFLTSDVRLFSSSQVTRTRRRWSGSGFGYNLCSKSVSEAHSYPPRVRGQHLVLLPHDAGVRALIDGVCHDCDVVIFQGKVAGMREFQKLAVFIPAVSAKEFFRLECLNCHLEVWHPVKRLSQHRVWR